MSRRANGQLKRAMQRTCMKAWERQSIPIDAFQLRQTLLVKEL
ncbi:hypothetical protein AALP_AA1G130700 [Arabis alpina]|uniref:Uncharacterized protein n=1 Tax=Arabis alpina TaxID=50452 RepID=A0A087HMY2_ARAAL|nr:hypothetical protein AALP_AA1G130700 [Arabis alpina]